jgi:hypothetical protein
MRIIIGMMLGMVVTLMVYSQSTGPGKTPPKPVTRSLTAGALESLPKTCNKGDLYVAWDDRRAMQIKTCGGGNVWLDPLNIGGSGAFQVNNGILDINDLAVPLLTAANRFSAWQRMGAGLSLDTDTAQPACSAANRGTFWYSDNGDKKDSVQVCVYSGSGFIWTALY